MTIRFDDSLPKLLEVCQAFGAPIDEDTVIVRDGVGKLTFVRERLPRNERLAQLLKTELGAYASSMPVVIGSLANRIMNDFRLRLVSQRTNDRDFTFKYADRRIVGSDWMLQPYPSPEGAKRLVFSSLKGGVGRSTALAVLSADLARRGKRVLAIDLDIEAPGIGFMLLPAQGDSPNGDLRPEYGVIDYLVENGLNGVDEYDLDKFIGVSPFADGFIDVLPASGRKTDQYPSSMIAKLSRALVEDVGSDKPKGLAEQIKEMVDRFASLKTYDAILVDARAGMAEVSAAALLGLGAEILMFGIDQPQTFRGYRYILSHLVDVAGISKLSVEEDWREKLTFVQSKAPSSPTGRNLFREKLYALCGETIYEAEDLDKDGFVELGAFNPPPEATGPGVPHDAIFVEYHPAYEAFDPLSERATLDADVYRGPFGAFLDRCKAILETSELDHEGEE